jgi:hypothetical protein
MALPLHRPFEFGASRDIIAMFRHKSVMGDSTYVFKPMYHHPANSAGTMRNVHDYVNIHMANVPFWARINK